MPSVHGIKLKSTFGLEKLRAYGINLKEYCMYLYTHIVYGVNLRDIVYKQAYMSWGKTANFFMRVRPVAYGGIL